MTREAIAASSPVARKNKRFKVFKRGLMKWERAEIRIHLLDISTHGVRASSFPLPMLDAKVTIICETVERNGTVVWVREPLFGVRFTLPVVQSVVDELLQND